MPRSDEALVDHYRNHPRLKSLVTFAHIDRADSARSRRFVQDFHFHDFHDEERVTARD